ncbi:Rpn family recombination-promoting nuclease/putative transposase, partial [Halorhodospira halochloris]|uniref:Rpn family recombination-promoting nuclease/putative transposase n=1 Tax=Halorhodospira halochloris TaxID=1052 RepID=UPI003B75CE3B
MSYARAGHACFYRFCSNRNSRPIVQSISGPCCNLRASCKRFRVVVQKRLTDDLPEPLPGSYVDDNLRNTYSDRLFKAWLLDGSPVFIYV